MRSAVKSGASRLEALEAEKSQLEKDLAAKEVLMAGATAETNGLTSRLEAAEAAAKAATETEGQAVAEAAMNKQAYAVEKELRLASEVGSGDDHLLSSPFFYSRIWDRLPVCMFI